MKQIFFSGVVFTLFFISCKKSDPIVEPTPLAPLKISKVDFASRYKPGGTPFTNSSVSAFGTLAIPVNGENQTWDVSGLSYAASTPVNIAATAPSNPAFLSATFFINGTSNFGVASLASNNVPNQDFYELNDAGYYYLGNATSAAAIINLPASIGGGTLTYAAQNITYSNKMQEVSFPISMGSQWASNNVVLNASFIANAAGVGVNNVPGQARDTLNTTNTIIASGTINLKNIGPVRVLINKIVLRDKSNYFLGGAPAPTALLTTLGIVDGAVTTTTIYEFYGEGYGRVGKIILNSAGTAIATAAFRTN